ncbi:hypothetical protein [Flammeovirga sp. SJP92]|uniref:hypothetical protein n=1 Tax=Flammeovirga sp. SJP92 TaxID=1775430 RepID=UPI0007894807|nr:hypothetical protein [Flammeovirga sp. SJP92]KXX70719.1 hypothetical protein AVL50_07855 [Flammeovirga sp. SJP92]
MIHQNINKETTTYKLIYNQYIKELNSMLEFNKGRLTKRFFEPQWALLPFHWFMKDFRNLKNTDIEITAEGFVMETAVALKDKYGIVLEEREVSNLIAGYNNILQQQTLFETVIEIEEERFFEDYDQLKKMKAKEQKIEEAKLQVLNLYASTKNILNSSVLNVSSYLDTIQKRPKLHKG